MERTPYNAPLPCFGFEHEAKSVICRSCQYQQDCLVYMGKRALRIPLSKLRFNLMPEGLVQKTDSDWEPDDPEIPFLGRLYLECFQSVFGEIPPSKDSATHYRKEINKNVQQTGCSTRLFILSNMVAHSIDQKIRIEHTDKRSATVFRAKYLTGKYAVTRAKKYAEQCHKEFGTFTLSSLSVLEKEDRHDNDLEQTMLNSEITAGNLVVGYKIHNGGPPYQKLYDVEELGLDPYWLAIEPSYKEHVLDAHLKKPNGTQMIRSHRYSVIQAVKQLKGQHDAGRCVFALRERIMPRAVYEVLRKFGQSPDDFEAVDTPVTNPMELWLFIGRALQEWHCQKYYRGEASMLARHA